MKKIVSILVFVLSTTFTFAQISVGVKAGVNYAYFPDIEDGVVLNFATQPILAYHIGAISELSISDRFALTAELLYSVKGSEIDQSTPGFPVVSTFANSYISLPISAKLKLGKLGILGGIEPSLLASERVRFNEGSWETANGLSNDLDFSLIGGVDFKLGKLYLAARYIHGLTNALEITFTDQNGEALGNGVNQNRVLQVSAGYFFLDKS